MKMNFCVPVGAFFVGIALGFGLAPRESVPKEASVEPTTAAPKKKDILPKRDVPRSEAVAPQEKMEEAPVVTHDAVKEAKPTSRHEDFFARMKRERPKDYIKMTNNMAKAKAERRAKVNDNLNFLASIDVSKFSEEATATHERLQELIARQEELSEKLNPLERENMSDEERRKNFEEMMKIASEISELNAAERDTLFRTVAEEMGCAEDDADTFVETLTDIIDATGGNFGGFGPRRTPPPRPPRGGEAK